MAKDITDTVKEKSAGAAKDIRAKVTEKTETKGTVEESREEIVTASEEKSE